MILPVGIGSLPSSSQIACTGQLSVAVSTCGFSAFCKLLQVATETVEASMPTRFEPSPSSCAMYWERVGSLEEARERKQHAGATEYLAPARLLAARQARPGEKNGASRAGEA
eukprot:763173-Hanusia_phi.AAC.2